MELARYVRAARISASAAVLALGSNVAEAQQFSCPKVGGHLVFGQQAKVNSLDTHTSSAASTRNIAMNVFETLLIRDENFAVMPNLAAAIDAFSPDLLVLAGFMRILGPAFVQRYEGRLLNIHPSLLPAFPGLHTHRRALEAGCQVVGATVHFVTPELDHGPIVMQSAVPVLPGDDEVALAARVLATEHVIYPLSVRWFVEGKLRIERGIVRHVDGESQLLA